MIVYINPHQDRTMEIKTDNLKDFKRQLKDAIHDFGIREAEIVEHPNSILYQAHLANHHMVILIPRKVYYDKRIRNISDNSMGKRKNTLEVFIQKRIAIAAKHTQVASRNYQYKEGNSG